MFIAAGHQPAADHILERFEIFRSMVPWFDGSVNLWLQRLQNFKKPLVDILSPQIERKNVPKSI